MPVTNQNSPQTSLSTQPNKKLHGVIKQLKKSKIVSSSFANKIEDENDINSVNDNLYTALHYAAKKGDLSAVIDLLDLGADFRKRNNRSLTPFLLAVQNGHKDIVSHFLSMDEMTAEDFSEKNAYEENAFHLATLNNHHDIVKLLLANKHIKSKKLDKEKSLLGYTPLGIAVRNKRDKIIKTLLDVPRINPQTLPNYGQIIRDLNQSNTNDKLMSYLKMKGVKGSSILEDKGNCNGWSFLFQIYITAGREDEFYDILNTIEGWSGKKDDFSSISLPDSLKSKYKDAEELFEQVTNDLVLFQQSTPAEDMKMSGVSQSSRAELYELVKDRNEQRQLRSLFNLNSTNLNKVQLVEMLEFFSRWPGTSIDMTVPEHSVSLYITPDGEFKYFDPNFKNKIITLKSPEQLADLIINFTFDNNKDDKYEINFSAYKFYNKAEKIPEKEVPLSGPMPFHSPNQFNKLHYAIMENDIEKVKQILTEEPHLIFEKNAHGITPFGLAISYQNELCLTLLKDAANSQGQPLPDLTQELDFSILATASPSFVQNLFTNGGLSANQKDVDGNTALHSTLGYLNNDLTYFLLKTEAVDVNQKGKYDKTVFLKAIEHNASKEILLQIIKTLKIDPQDLTKRNPLIYAIRANVDKEVILQLIQLFKNSKISLDWPDRNGMTALMHAMECNADVSVIQALLSDPNLLPNGGDHDSMTALMYGLKHHANSNILLTLISDPKTEVNYNNDQEDDKTDLMFAFEYNADAHVIQAILSKYKSLGENINNYDNDGKSALMYALKYGAGKETIKQILSFDNLNINAVDHHGKTALMLAFMYEVEPEIIEMLLQAPSLKINMKDKKNKTAIMHAFEYGVSKSVIQLFLLDPKFDPNQQDDRDQTPLMYALKNNIDPDIILMLVLDPRTTVNLVNELQQSTLMVALKNKADAGVIKAIIDKFQATNINEVDEEGLTALMYACIYKQNESTIQEILKCTELKINQSDDDGNTALMHAVLNDASENFIQLLLDQPGIRINQRNDDKRTALILAVREKNEELVKKLLDSGADVSIKDKNGKTAEDYAKSSPKLLSLFNPPSEKASKRKSLILSHTSSTQDSQLKTQDNEPVLNNPVISSKKNKAP